MVTILIPTALRNFTGGSSAVHVEAANVGEAVDALCRKHPDIAKHLRDDAGKLRSFVNLYLGDEDVRFLQQDQTPLSAGNELMIVPSIAGGGR